MLRCPYCKVDISTKTDVCPLCHTNLVTAGVPKTEIKRMEHSFPRRSKLPPFSSNLFDIVYIVVALNVIIASIFVELLITQHVKVTWIIAALALYFYVFLRVTLRRDEYFPQKVAGQALLLTVVVYSTRAVLPEPRIIIEYILPAIYLASVLMIGIFLLINYKKPNRYLLNLISIALLSVMPYVLVMIANTESPLFSFITAIIGGLIFVTAMIFYAKPILSELRRQLHT